MEDAPTDAEALLIPVMLKGKRIGPMETLETIRERTTQSVAHLSADVRDVGNPTVPQAQISVALQELTDCTRRSQLVSVC